MSYFVNLARANTENSRLSAELTALVGERDKLTLALAERDAASESCRAQFDATFADLTEKLSVSTEQVAVLTAAAQTAGQQAAEIVAAQGLPTALLPTDGQPPHASAADLGQQIRAEADPAKRAALYAQLQSVWNSKN